MPKRGQRDHSPGDARRRYSDRGGPGGRHAETHDVRREALTNPKGLQPTRSDAFVGDIAPDTSTAQPGGHEDESSSAADDKRLHERLDMLQAEELDRLSILEQGVRLEQGGTYLDLNDLERGPFTALGAQEAGPGNRYVAKRDTDHELWNRLVGKPSE
jgi:hypothetical protein